MQSIDPKNPKSKSGERGNSPAPEDRQAEVYSYLPPSASAIRRMDQLWLKFNRPGASPEADQLEPRSQTETVWAVLCKAGGAQVPQFELQHPEGVGIGKGWVALLNPRLHELRNRYGFRIENRTERVGADIKSWYWLALEADGTPRKDHPLAWRETGRPKSRRQRGADETAWGNATATVPAAISMLVKDPARKREPKRDTLFDMGNPIRSAIGL